MRLPLRIAPGIVIWLAPAAAQSIPATPLAPVPVELPRTRLELGGGLWAGDMMCDSPHGSCHGFAAAGGINLAASWFFIPQFGIGADVWAMAHNADAVGVEHVLVTANAILRPLPRLTLQVGFGDSYAHFRFPGTVESFSSDAVALLGGGMIDVWTQRRWALSLGARFGTGFHGHDITARSIVGGAEVSLFGF